MVKAIRFDKTGGPEVMKWVDVEVGEPGAGEIRIRQTRGRPELYRRVFPHGPISAAVAGRSRHGSGR